MGNSMKIEGYLYGHYDSRGGAMFIALPTREEADKLYAAGFMHNQVFDTPAEVEEADKQVIEDDFLGPATLECERRPEEGEDFGDFDPDDPTVMKLWARYREDGEWCTEWQGTPGESELILSVAQPPGFAESELAEDAYGVLFVSEAKTLGI
jgi:hypothetical protein